MGSDWAGDNTFLLAATCLAAVTALIYLVARARAGREPFRLMDGLILVAIMAIIAATAIPLLEGMRTQAKTAVLLQNLQTMRTQIALYKAQHGGECPLLYQGSVPQLCQATDGEGIPGPPSVKRPFGPYLPEGIPVNPFTGRSLVVAVEEFPPKSATGNGGWLYHAATGSIAADVPGFLSR